jgi:hypothetical protein
MFDRGFRSRLLGDASVTKVRRAEIVLLFALSAVASALAQGGMAMGPPVGAGSGPAYDVSVGYTYLAMMAPSASTVNFNGLDASGSVDLNRRWGATVDSSYVRTADVIGTGQDGYVLSLLAGPAFYPLEGRNTRVLVRALAGAGLVDSVQPVSGTSYLHGWVARPSYAFGAGIERSMFGPFALRLNGDYLRTEFADSSGNVQPRNNLRVTASIVFRLNERPR